MLHNDDDVDYVTMTPSDIRFEQIDFSTEIYKQSIAPIIFADPLAYNEVRGKLVGDFKIPLTDARKYNKHICRLIASFIERINPGWNVTVTHAFTAKNEFALYVTLCEQ